MTVKLAWKWFIGWSGQTSRVNKIFKRPGVGGSKCSDQVQPVHHSLSQSWVEIILASWPQFQYSQKGLLWENSCSLLSISVILENANFVGKLWIHLLIPLNRHNVVQALPLSKVQVHTHSLATQILYIDFEIITWYFPCNWEGKFKLKYRYFGDSSLGDRNISLRYKYIGILLT